MDKHSSLLRKFVNYGKKSFITLAPGEDFYTDVGYLEAATNVYSGMAKLESGNFLTESSQGILKGEVSLYH